MKCAEVAGHRRICPNTYWITCYREIKAPDNVAANAELAAPALASYGVRYLCRGTASTTFEAGLKQRVVVPEFPSLDQALVAHYGPGYQQALGDGAVRDIRIIEGLE